MLDGVELVEEEVVRETRRPRQGAREQIDAPLMEAILDQIVGADVEVRRDAVVRALLAFTWTQRLYFIVRSALMGGIGAAVTGAIVVILGEVNAVQVAVISVGSFVATLAITRLIDAQVTNTAKRIVHVLSRHRQLRSLVLDHF